MKATSSRRLDQCLLSLLNNPYRPVPSMNPIQTRRQEVSQVPEHGGTGGSAQESPVANYCPFHIPPSAFPQHDRQE